MQMACIPGFHLSKHFDIWTKSQKTKGFFRNLRNIFLDNQTYFSNE